jgi:hypothetical protein
MRVASGEITIGCWEAWIVLHREEELRESLIEAPAEQKRSANYIENLTARTETQRSLDTLDCSLKLAGKKPENATDIPTAGKTRVERQRPIDQDHHGADILTEGGHGDEYRNLTILGRERPVS